MTHDPDFVLCTEGRDDLSHPRLCWRRKRLRDNIRDDYLVVDIAPPIIGQRYGLGEKDITQVLLATRHQGITLFPVTEWPAHVYVYRILDDAILEQEVLDEHQVAKMTWGIIFRSLSEAGDCAR